MVNYANRANNTDAAKNSDLADNANAVHLAITGKGSEPRGERRASREERERGGRERNDEGERRANGREGE